MDGLWATAAGLGVGALLGLAIGRLVLYLRREHKEAVGLDDFLALGLIALSYGAALLLHAYGFLAVFAAGVALRHLEQSQSAGAGQPAGGGTGQRHTRTSRWPTPSPCDRHHAPAFMAQAVLGFNQQVERIGELAIVITIGALLWAVQWHHGGVVVRAAVAAGIRPLAVGAGTDRLAAARAASAGSSAGSASAASARSTTSCTPSTMACPVPLADQLIALTLSVVVTSIIVHGLSVTPMMAAYEKTVRRGRSAVSAEPAQSRAVPDRRPRGGVANRWL